MGVILSIADTSLSVLLYIFLLCHKTPVFSIFKFPYLPKKKEVGEEIVDALGKIKKSINKVLDGLKALNLDDMDNVENQKFATIETLLLKLFIEFDKEKSQIKKIQNVLSFSDLESFMLKLSEKENLFAGIKYVPSTNITSFYSIFLY